VTLLCTNIIKVGRSVLKIQQTKAVSILSMTKKTIFRVHDSQGSAETLVRSSNISTKHCQNRLMCIEVIVCNVTVVFLRHSVCAVLLTMTTLVDFLQILAVFRCRWVIEWTQSLCVHFTFRRSLMTASQNGVSFVNRMSTRLAASYWLVNVFCRSWSYL